MNKRLRLGILVSSLGNFGEKGFYNTQEVGLAEAIGALCEEVIVYKYVSGLKKIQFDKLHNCKNGTVYYLPGKGVGINGFVDTACLDKNLDALLYYSDTQLSVPKVAKWAKKNGVLLIPYIGTIESHSSNKMKKTVMNLLFRRNLAVYRKIHCAAKTPTVKAQLEKAGVSDVTVAPVGLDLALLNQDYEVSEISLIKQKYGYDAEDKVILFIGRMTEEKKPLRMVEIFDRLYRRDKNYKLLMVGSGELQEAVAKTVEDRGLAGSVKLVGRILNADIWELYRIAECFVNLNEQEIFGMAILEAMYYDCKVVAWEAPGPSFIIEDGVSGFLADSEKGIITAIAERTIAPEEAHRRIMCYFTWDRTAGDILAIAENYG